MIFILKGDSGAGLVQYADKYRNRAVLIGILTKIKHKRGLKECREGDYKETHFINVIKHLQWIKSTIFASSLRN